MRYGYARLLAAISMAAALVVIGATGALAQASKVAKQHAIEQGQQTFNSKCAHCHGEDAATDDAFFNLPQLLSNKSDAFFFETVSNGIGDKGMPPWKGILKRRQMENILSFVRSVEEEQGLIEKSSDSQ
jgi:mono/diheme cytochrome c family protein